METVTMCAAKKTKITITREDLITFAKRWLESQI